MLWRLGVQSNPLNGSPDNGSIWLVVQDLASPILKCSLNKSLSDNGSIGLLVQFLADKTVKSLGGSDCTYCRSLCLMSNSPKIKYCTKKRSSHVRERAGNATHNA